MKLRYGTSIFLSLALFASPALSQTQTIFSENFESFAPGAFPTPNPLNSGWSLGNGTSALWHVASAGECGSVTKMAAYNIPAAPSCNYKNGGPHIGRLYSPAFTLVGQAPFTLTIKYLRDVPFDTTALWVTNATTTQHLYSLGSISTDASTVTTTNVELWNSQPGQTIRLEFEFLGSAIGLGGFGWLIDEITVTSTVPAVPPSVSSVAPLYGPNSGMAGVAITGSDFVGMTSVRFGGVEVPFTVDSPTQITANLPAVPISGWVDVEVENADGQDLEPNAFNFFIPPVDIGSTCSPLELIPSGEPCIGRNFTTTTTGLLPGQEQSLLVDWSNASSSIGGGVVRPIVSGSLQAVAVSSSIVLAPFTPLCPPSSCATYVFPDQIINLGTNPSHTFSIPNDPSLVGVHLFVQAIAKSCPVLKTQGLDVVIGE